MGDAALASLSQTAPFVWVWPEPVSWSAESSIVVCLSMSLRLLSLHLYISSLHGQVGIHVQYTNRVPFAAKLVSLQIVTLY